METTKSSKLFFNWKIANVTCWTCLSCSVVSDSLRPHGNLQARILKQVAFPFSRGPSQSRDWTQVSRITGGFFTSWATREAPLGLSSPLNHKSVTYLFWQWANLDVTWSVGITWSAAHVEDSRALYTSLWQRRLAEHTPGAMRCLLQCCLRMCQPSHKRGNGGAETSEGTTLTRAG